MNTISPQNVVVILQARMGASRLPGKPLKTVLGRPLLSYQIERLRKAKRVDTLVVATTTDVRDDPIAALCMKEGVPTFRGSETDVLDRYYKAAKQFHADTVVRITGDCPLIDPVEVDRVIARLLEHTPHYDYVSNSLERTFPRGLDVEAFRFPALERAAREAKAPEEREHVTPYFYRHPEIFSIGSVTQPTDQSHHRWTVDTADDFELISRILSTLYPANPDFTTGDILKLLAAHPDWVSINAHVQQKGLSG